MKLESTEPILFCEFSWYKKDYLDMQPDSELQRILSMLTKLKESQNPNG